MTAHYVLAVTIGIDSAKGRVEPERIRVTYRREAPPPGEPGWLFFRDYCWRGELNAPDAVRDLVAEDLGLASATDGGRTDRGAVVEAVELRALETDGAYREALEDAIADDLDAFRADSTREVLHKYLGSKLEVRED